MTTIACGTDNIDSDTPHLHSQAKRVLDLMRDGHWRTLRQIAAETCCLETGASARLRDLRKARFGGHVVELRPVPGRRGLFQYRLLLKDASR